MAANIQVGSAGVNLDTGPRYHLGPTVFKGGPGTQLAAPRARANRGLRRPAQNNPFLLPNGASDLSQLTQDRGYTAWVKLAPTRFLSTEVKVLAVLRNVECNLEAGPLIQARFAVPAYYPW